MQGERDPATYSHHTSHSSTSSISLSRQLPLSHAKLPSSISIPKRGGAPGSSNPAATTSTGQADASPAAAWTDSDTPLPSPRRRPTHQTPATPNFSISADGTVGSLAASSDQFRSGAGSRPATLHSHQPSSTRINASVHDDELDGDYFHITSEKYPPRLNGNNNLSSVHLPLLGGGDESGSSIDYDRPLLQRGASNGASGGGGRFASVLSSRARLHPIMLLPSFFIGIFVALSGLVGKPMTGRFHHSSNLQTVGANRPNYTIHTSGHLFLHPSSLDPSSVTSPLSVDASSRAPHDVRHPIHDLIGNATREWEAKLKRQSKTLEQAVREYKRRHGRKPPKGFDDWFRFAQDNEVVLIDEFDQTFTDVLPFYAMPPSTIHNRSMVLQRDPSTFTMVIRKGEVEITGAHKADGRAKDQAALMKRWTKWVPDVNVSMSAHDGPSIMMDDRGRRRHVEAAKKGVYLTQPELDGVDEDAALWGFPLACSPNSRLRRSYDGLEIASLPAGPSYVSDHIKTMDLCENPEWQYLHGFTAWPGMRPQILRPLFSFAKTSLHSDLLLTPLEQYWDYEPWDPVWEKKLHNKAVWRGSTTGVWFDRGTWWRSSQRVRLWFMSKDKTGHQLVRFDGVGQESADGVESIAERNVSTSDLIERYLDFAFTGKESQCSEEDGSCEAVRQLIDFQPTFGWNEANEFKYALDLDGNAWSGRFHRLLQSNSVILKSTIFPEWYAGWIQPWVHYVPIKIDYTDLFDVMAFFAGDLDGNNGHEELAKQIAAQGKEYTAKHWRYADMEAYFFRLALEWARCSSPDRAAMDYNGSGA